MCPERALSGISSFLGTISIPNLTFPRLFHLSGQVVTTHVQLPANCVALFLVVMHDIWPGVRYPLTSHHLGTLASRAGALGSIPGGAKECYSCIIFSLFVGRSWLLINSKLAASFDTIHYFITHKWRGNFILDHWSHFWNVLHNTLCFDMDCNL